MDSTFQITSYRVRPDARNLNRVHDGNAQSHGVDRMAFPGGERHIVLGDTVVSAKDGFWEIQANLYTPEGVMDLLLIADALRRHIPEQAEISLFLPYVPYARQDRVANSGEPLSAAVFCRLVNSLNFSHVLIADPHSDVVPALLDRVQVLPAELFLRQLLEPIGALANIVHSRQVALVAPDAGARKRVENLGIRLDLPVVYAHKHRDTRTGKLSGVGVQGEVPDLPLLVVDDICDGGGTFILLGKELAKRTSKPLYLYVTHGLFTKGLAAMQDYYEGIFCAYCANPSFAKQTMLIDQSVPA